MKSHPISNSGRRKIAHAIARGWRPGLSIRDVLRPSSRREAGKSG